MEETKCSKTKRLWKKSSTTFYIRLLNKNLRVLEKLGDFILSLITENYLLTTILTPSRKDGI
ncbi:MAG: hypothetical protein M1282_11855, partial [Chloroflexi bacterium]|nr:hypothetical protein [Chloroflexota bacterium]